MHTLIEPAKRYCKRCTQELTAANQTGRHLICKACRRPGHRRNYDLKRGVLLSRLRERRTDAAFREKQSKVSQERYRITLGLYRKQKRCRWCREVLPWANKAFCSDHCKESCQIAHGTFKKRPVPDNWLTRVGAAKWFRLGRPTIKRWIREGLATHRRDGQLWLDREDVIQWIGSGKAVFDLRKSTGRKSPGPRNDPSESGVIYRLVDPRTNKTRYVGKTRDIANRQRRYLAGHGHNPHMRNWLRLLISAGLKPRIEIVQSCLYRLGDAERYWIAEYRRKGCDLLNQTDGGDSGQLISDESRAKLGARSRANWADPAYRAKQDARFAVRRAITNQRERDRAEQRKQRRETRIAARDAAAEARKKPRLTIVPLTCNGVAFVPLTHGAYAIVDADDWHRVSRFKWSLQIKGDMERAKRSVHRDDGNPGAELLTRAVANAGDGIMVRPKNGDHLDCRRANLSIVQQRGGKPAAA